MRRVVARERRGHVLRVGLATQLGERLKLESIFFVSASSGDGVADLKADLAARIPEGPWHFPAEQVSDAIFGTYVVPFEAISVLLLAALVGAIVLARKD